MGLCLPRAGMRSRRSASLAVYEYEETGSVHSYRSASIGLSNEARRAG